jgi:hypothetical protein
MNLHQNGKMARLPDRLGADGNDNHNRTVPPQPAWIVKAGKTTFPKTRFPIRENSCDSHLAFFQQFQ